MSLRDDKRVQRIRTLSLREAPKEFKVALLKELGYRVQGSKVLTAKGDPYIDPFSEIPVTVENFVVLPGRSPPLVLDDSPLSLSCYLEEYGDIL